MRIEAFTTGEKKKKTEEKRRIHTSLYDIVSLTTLVLFNVVPKYNLIFVGVAVAAAVAAVVCTLFVRWFGVFLFFVFFFSGIASFPLSFTIILSLFTYNIIFRFVHATI